VYAVDASASVHIARQLADQNGFAGVVEVLQGKVEEVTLPQRVDVIVSEPIGFLLVHERMLESYIAARDRFLKPGGLMMPTTGSIVLAPMTGQWRGSVIVCLYMYVYICLCLCLCVSSVPVLFFTLTDVFLLIPPQQTRRCTKSKQQRPLFGTTVTSTASTSPRLSPQQTKKTSHKLLWEISRATVC
jgi:hypothetical protein